MIGDATKFCRPSRVGGLLDPDSGQMAQCCFPEGHSDPKVSPGEGIISSGSLATMIT